GLVTDGISRSAVKAPQLLPAHDPRPAAAGDGTSLSWPIGTEGGAARLQLGDRAAHLAADGPAVTWSVDLEVPPHGTTSSSWQLDLTDPAVPFTAAEGTWDAALPPS